MKLRELIEKLNHYDMDSDVTVHAANGTKSLKIKSFNLHTEREMGDTTEPRLTLICYDDFTVYTHN
jgi:hypothetical protein